MSDQMQIWIWAAFIVCVIAYLCCVKSLFSYLKAHHPATWMALGSPTLFLNNSIRNNWVFLKFLFSREQGGGDPGVVNRAIAIRILLLVSVLLMAVVIFSKEIPWAARG
jgi:hypothetical protein